VEATVRPGLHRSISYKWRKSGEWVEAARGCTLARGNAGETAQFESGKWRLARV